MGRAVTCPVCKGTGEVADPMYGDSTGTKRKKCHGCFGKGWVEVSDR